VRALLAFLLFAVVATAVVVFVVVPYAAGPVITGVLQSSGIVQGGSVTIETKGTGPELVGGHADALHVRGQDLVIQGLLVGDADVTIRDVALFDRTFDAIDGTLLRVRVPVDNGPVVTIASIDLDGPAEAVAADGRLDASEANAVIREATARVGVRIDEATMGDGVVRLRRGDVAVDASLTVRGGSLVLEPDGGLSSVVLMESRPDDPWQLRSVTITPGGLELSGTVDVRRFSDDSVTLAP